MLNNVLKPNQSSSLDDWLAYLENIHPLEIEMGLARVRQVAEQLDLLEFTGKVILIAGTNGKGTTARCLEALLLDQGFAVGTFSSPHLIRYNERVRVNGKELVDSEHIQAFQAIDSGRGNIQLTYFEFGTLAALEIFKRKQPDFILFEVGLGGRLDASNILNPDVSVITTVDLDHKEFLGDTRELVGREKAGIFRANRPAVVGDLDIPNSVIDYGRSIQANLILSGTHFTFEEDDEVFYWNGQSYAKPGIPAQNAATALTVLEQLQCLPDFARINSVLAELNVEGRFQCLSQSPSVYADVAHNPQSALYLRKKLLEFRNKGKQVIALCAMLKDKDQATCIENVIDVVDKWHLAGLEGSRGASSHQLEERLDKFALQAELHNNVAECLDTLMPQLNDKQVLIVFGSFFTVADCINYFSEYRSNIG